MDNKQRTAMDAAYWVGHLVVIIATVAGVYLAATVGFEKAVDLELLESDRDTYYLAAAFHGELEDNVNAVLSFSDTYKAQPYYAEQHRLQLNQYVFETMRFASSTFELRPQILNAASRYYSEVNETLAKLGQRQLGKPFALDRLTMLTKQFQSGALTLLDADVAKLKRKLESAGIPL